MADSELVLWATKGTSLTPTEIDGNFTWLNNRLSALAALFGAVLNTNGTLKSPQVYYAESATGDDDYEVTLSPVPTALSDLTGDLIIMKADVANADENATFNPNGLGATAITKDGATAIVASDIKAGGITLLVFDGTQFQLK